MKSSRHSVAWVSDCLTAILHKPVVAACALAASVLLACLTHYQPIMPLMPGIDASWAFALNYIHQHQLVMGRDVQFTFGPLGFLEHIRGLDHETVYHTNRFWFGMSVLANLFVLLLCAQTGESKSRLCINLLAGCFLISCMTSNMDRVFMLVYTGLFLHWRSRHMIYLLLLPLLVALCLLVKFSYGIVTLALLLPYFLLGAIQERQPKWIANLLLIPVFYSLLWWASCNTLDGAADYLRYGIEFSRGSASAMALNPANNDYAIVGFYSVFIVCLLAAALTDNRAQFLPCLCFTAVAFIWMKYAFGREDNTHLSSLMTFAFLTMSIWLIVSRSTSIKLVQAFGILLCILAWQRMHSAETGAPILASTPTWYSPLTFRKNRWNIDERIQKWEKASARNLSSLQLPASIMNTIGNHSVDIYPWEILIVAANHLTWQPRPVFQNYITYTPVLDNANRAFFNSERAPEFIVWHYHDAGDIDSRYPLNTDPMTQQAIIAHYHIKTCEAAFCLWEKSDTAQMQAEEKLSLIHAPWDTWITVPASQKDFIRAELTTTRTFSGKFNLLFWKEGGSQIDYRLRDGSIKTHSLVLDTASAGIWASPWLERFSTPTGENHFKNNVEAIRLRTSRPWAFDPDIQIVWNATNFINSRPW